MAGSDRLKKARRSADRARGKAFRTVKAAFQTVRPRADRTTVAMILGCQRSGTTLLTRAFDRDWNSTVFQEFSALSRQDPNGIRLDPTPELLRTLGDVRTPLVVCKPLVESQNARQLLEVLPNARAIWLYRHHRDVASSNLKAFGEGNGIRDLDLLLHGDGSDWRSEKLSPGTRSTISDHYSEEMDPHDAAALFWFARNSLFFEQNLDQHEDVLLVSYPQLVTTPGAVMREIYSFLEVPHPRRDLTVEFHADSVGRGAEVRLSPEVEALCASLLHRLDSSQSRRSATFEG